MKRNNSYSASSKTLFTVIASPLIRSSEKPLESILDDYPEDSLLKKGIEILSKIYDDPWKELENKSRRNRVALLDKIRNNPIEKLSC